ncbi:MAG: hypothetical protein R3F50_03530 [Gammaproteobacteria bacterium]
MFNYLKNKRLTKLREAWENPRHWDRDLSSISALFELTQSELGKTTVDDKTWLDLDLNSLFRKIDATMTSVGQQYLYRKLRTLESPDGCLEDDYYVASLLQEDQATREKLQIWIGMLKEGDAKSVTKVLFSNFPVVNFPILGIALWSLFSVITIVFGLVSGGGYLFLILPILIANFSLARYFERVTDNASYVLPYLYIVIAVSERLAGLTLEPRIPACMRLKELKKPIRKVRKALKLVSISQNHESILINNMMYLINLAFPYDVIAYSLSMKKVISEIDVMRSCFLSIGSLDASISIAAYLNHHPQTCNPELTDELVIELQDAYHPLLEEYVSNSFSTNGRSALITGSNMAGKTTFIKTIGVNLVLSRTLWICHADYARFPVVDIFSSIKTADGLEEGKSFYFSELERIKQFLEMAKRGHKCLILIDEIYRGTNTVERIAGSAAVLQELATNNLVFVTTHDIELANYLNEQFDLWYFEETGSRTNPFDYKLRSGVCRTRNAIKLMENMGYPESITNIARRFVKDMEL